MRVERLFESWPELFSQLIPGLNADENLKKIAPGSNKKLWWQCTKFNDHVWDDSPYSRTSLGRGCLICSNKRILSGFNDLATKNPELAKQWHASKNGDLTPADVFPSSNKTFWWKCLKNELHEWEQSPNNQGKSKVGCPICSNHKVLPGENDLATKFPQVIAKWDWVKNVSFTPSSITPGSPRNAFWLCDLGHSFSSPIVNVTQGAGCPYCSSKALLEGFNDLATTHPELLRFFSPNNSIRPNQIMAGSDVSLEWVCESGHTWWAQVKNIKNGRRCPVCASKKLLPGFNDLATKYPLIAEQWHPNKNGDIKATEVIGGGSRDAWWRCGFGHEWRSTIANRVFFNSGCPVCQNVSLLVGANDMLTTNPKLAEQFDLGKNFPDTPETVIASTHKMLWWACDLGHSWKATGNTRVSQGTGCPFCSGKKVLAGFNDLATRYPQLCEEWHPKLNGELTPKQVSGGTHRKVWWLCDKGHDYYAAIVNRAAGASNCQICVNQQVLAGFNDLASQWPALLPEWDYEKNSPVRPEAVVARSEKKYWWLCVKGHSWRVAPGVRIRVGTGCPTCAKRGYSQASTGVFYFIQNSSLGARKVGIANQKSTRLSSWIEMGWEVIFRFDSDDGGLILELETRVLRWLRQDLGYPPYLSQVEIGKLRGWSETFSEDGVSNYEVILRVEEEISRLTNVVP